MIYWLSSGSPRRPLPGLRRPTRLASLSWLSSPVRFAPILMAEDTDRPRHGPLTEALGLGLGLGQRSTFNHHHTGILSIKISPALHSINLRQLYLTRTEITLSPFHHDISSPHHVEPSSHTWSVTLAFKSPCSPGVPSSPREAFLTRCGPPTSTVELVPICQKFTCGSVTHQNAGCRTWNVKCIRR